MSMIPPKLNLLTTAIRCTAWRCPPGVNQDVTDYIARYQLENAVTQDYVADFVAGVVAASPAWYWRVEETTGTIAADTIGNDSLTYEKAASSGGYNISGSIISGDSNYAKKMSSVGGSAIYDDSATGYRNAGSLSTSDFTIELAFFIEAGMAAESVLLGKYQTDNEWKVNLTSSANVLELTLQQSDLTDRSTTICASLSGAGVTTDEAWHYLSIRMDFTGASELTCEIDGALQSTTDVSTWSGSWRAGAADTFSIGEAFGSTDYWRGGVDEIQIYLDAITDPQRATNYANWSVNPAPADFICEYKLDTNGNDTTGSHHAANQGLTPYTIGFVDGCAWLNGVTQYYIINTESALRPTNVTVCAWLKTDYVDGSNYSIFQSFSINTNVAGYELHLDSGGQVEFTVGSNTGTTKGTHWDAAKGATRVNDDSWHHVVGTYNGTTIKVYVDGFLDGQETYAGGLAYPFPATYVRLGGYQVDASITSTFNGYLDGVQMFDYEASLAQIRSLSRIAQSETFHNLAGLIYNDPISIKDNGIIGQSTSFDGIDQYIALQNSDTLRPNSEITVCAWIQYGDEFDSYATIVQNYSRNTFVSGWSLYYDSGVVGFLVGDNSGVIFNQDYTYVESNTEFESDGLWRHICGTYDGELVKIYVDGVLEDLQDWSSTIFYDLSETLPLIGVKTQNGGLSYTDYYKGAIDDIRIYDRAVTADEVTTIVASRVNGPPRDFIACWLFENNILDVTGYNIGSNLGTPNFIDGYKGDTALNFNASEAITILDNIRLQPPNGVSVSAWVKTYQASAFIFQSYSRITYRAGFHLDVNFDGYLAMTVGDDVGDVEDVNWSELVADTVDEIIDGEWHHLCGTYDRENMNLYIDGLLVATKATTVALGYNASNSPTIAMRTYQGTVYSQGLLGQMDELFVYPRALSADEVQQMGAYTGCVPGVCAWEEAQEIPDYVFRLELENADATITSTAYTANTCSRGGAPTVVAGVIGNAVEFAGESINEGEGDEYEITDNAIMKPAKVSVSVWIKTSADGTVMQQASDVGSLIGGYRISVSSGLARFTIGKRTGSVEGTDWAKAISTTTVTDGFWRHVCGTFDQSNIRIYIDGVLENTVALSGPIGFNPSESYGSLACYAPSSGGKGSPVLSNFFTGAIDDLRVYDRGLVDQEVETLVLSKLQSPPVDYEGAWLFNLNVDDVTGVHDGTLTGSASYSNGVEGGNSLLLNGAYVTVANATALTPDASDFSICGWIKFADTSVSTDVVVSKNDSGFTGGYRIYVENGDLYGDIYDSGSQGPILIGPAINDGYWHHFVMTFDYSILTLKGYVDGRVSVTEDLSGGKGSGSVGGSTVDLVIGKDSTTATNYFNGYVDAIKYYNKVLTLQEVNRLAGYTGCGTVQSNLYNAVMAIGPQWYWQLDELNGLLAYDKAGNDNLSYGQDVKFMTQGPSNADGIAAYNGTNNYIGLAPSRWDGTTIMPVGDLASNFTIEFAFRQTPIIDDGATFFSKFGDSYDGWNFYYYDDSGDGTDYSLEFDLVQTNGNWEYLWAESVQTKGFVFDNSWCWISVVMDFAGGTWNLYRNNVLVHSEDVTTLSGAWQHDIEDFGVGCDRYNDGIADGWHDFDGMDEVAIYNKALSTAERLSTYNAWAGI